MHPRPFHLLAAGLLAAAIPLLAGCNPRPPTLTLTLSRAELQQAVAERLPVTREKLVVAVTFRDPQVILREGDSRIGLDLEAEAKLPLIAPIRGRIAALGEVAYDPAGRSFFFRSPDVEKLDFPVLPPEARGLAESAIEELAAPALESTPVYTLKDRTLEERTAGYLLRNVSVRDGRLHLTLGLPEGEAPAERAGILSWLIGLACLGFLIALSAGILKRVRTSGG